jgi:PAS domain S-box-containing protein
MDLVGLELDAAGRFEVPLEIASAAAWVRGEGETGFRVLLVRADGPGGLGRLRELRRQLDWPRLLAWVQDSSLIPDCLGHGADDVCCAGAMGPEIWARVEVMRWRASARKEEARQALHSYEAKLRTVLGHSPDGFLIHHNGVIRFVNRAAASMAGATNPEELVGRRLLDFAPEPDRAQFEPRMRDMDRGGQPGELEQTRVVGPDGRIRVVEIRAFPISFEREPSIMIISRDISEKLELQRRMEIADRLASLGTLTAGVAHEINNPLACVISALAYLDEECAQSARLSAEEREALDDARQSAQRVKQIVHKMQALTRGEAVPETLFDINEVIDRAAEVCARQMADQARLVKALEPVALMRGDPLRLEEVFVNLLSNAANAITPGAPEQNEISVRVSNPRGAIEVEVSDTGVGMTLEVQRRIFDPFFTTHPTGAGTGLGLSICHEIILAHRGKISVSSTPGQGATFRLQFPVDEEAQETLPRGTGGGKLPS